MVGSALCLMLYDGNFNHNEFVSAILWESVVFKGIGYLCIEDVVEERSNLKFLFMNKTKIMLIEILREYHNCQLSVDGVGFSFVIFWCSFAEVFGSHFFFFLSNQFLKNSYFGANI